MPEEGKMHKFVLTRKDPAPDHYYYTSPDCTALMEETSTDHTVYNIRARAYVVVYKTVQSSIKTMDEAIVKRQINDSQILISLD